jgi:hypothetical protein
MIEASIMVATSPAFEAFPLGLLLLTANATAAAAAARGGPCSEITSTSFRTAYPGSRPDRPIAAGAFYAYYLGLFHDHAPLPARPWAQSAMGLAPSAVALPTPDPALPSALVSGLAPGTSYTLRWRARAAAAANPGFGWGNWSAPFVCRTTATAGAAPTRLRAGGAARAGHAAAAAARAVRMYRVSEFSLDVDFLSNHSSGDAAGEAALLSAFVKRPGSPGQLHVNRSCLDALSAACPSGLH